MKYLSRFFLVGLLYACLLCSASAAESPPFARFLTASAHYFHSSDLLFGTFVEGTAYSLNAKAIHSRTGLGAGVSYVYSRRKSDYASFGAIVAHELSGILVYRLARFRKPFSIDPYIGVGAGVFYMQETTIPTVILRYGGEDFVSDSDRTLVGTTLELGIPMRITKHVGIILQINNEFALLSEQETNFDESFQIGGLGYGIGICYYF
ncbi:MAG: hypothetical protein ABIJ00_10515 [Candidatus Eisenbacteria bacterium]